MARTKQPEKHKIKADSQVKVKQSFLSSNMSVALLLLVGFIGGFLWLSGLRFFLVQSPETHYHANFAVFINGEREDFEEFTYYEEVAACTSDYADNPKGRVHMHDKINDVIHVHDKRVTYGNFFQNIGWNVGDEYLATLDNVYQSNATHKLVYLLNGEEVENIATRVIGNTDKLLVSYDVSGADRTQQNDLISTTAEEVNKYQDPASCSGVGGTGHNSLGAKLKRATFWL